MKIVESWLREWVDPGLDTRDLAHQLTMLGLEVDEITIEGEGLDGVVVGRSRGRKKASRTLTVSAFAGSDNGDGEIPRRRLWGTQCH